MTPGLVIAVVVAAIILITIAKGVRLVPQGDEWIVERLGRYQRTLIPGLNILIPYMDNVAYKLVTKDQILDIEQQEVITKDNAVILTNALCFVKVTDPVKAVYGVTDYKSAISNLTKTTLRQIIGEMELDEALSRATSSSQAARQHGRAGRRLGSDRQGHRDSGHLAVGVHAARNGDAGRRRARAQGNRHPRRGRQAGGDSRSRGAPGISQARRLGAGRAGHGFGHCDQAGGREHRQ